MLYTSQVAATTEALAILERSTRRMVFVCLDLTSNKYSVELWSTVFSQPLLRIDRWNKRNVYVATAVTDWRRN